LDVADTLSAKCDPAPPRVALGTAHFLHGSALRAPVPAT